MYINRSQEWLERLPPDRRPLDLWLVPGTASPASPNFISMLFKKLVSDSRRAFGGVETLVRGSREREKVPIGIHQMRKLAATYASLAGHEEQQIRIKLGFSDVRILRKNYIAQAPPLREACVLPGGTFIPSRVHEFSDSD